MVAFLGLLKNIPNTWMLYFGAIVVHVVGLEAYIRGSSTEEVA